MKRFLKSEAGAAVVWVIAALFLAAVIFPWLYSAGKDFGEYAKTNDLNNLFESVGKSCLNAKPGRYFNRALLLSAICTLPFLIRRIRSIRKSTPAFISLTKYSVSLPNKLAQLAISFAISASLLWLTGILLYKLGAYTPEANPTTFSKISSKAVLPAIGASLIEEWIFRGLLLGLWLRFTGPITACIGSSLFFSFLHFLQPPATFGDPGHILAGFVMLGETLMHFINPQFFITGFITLTVVGLILAWARIRTGALWFCFGLHAGWVFSMKLFSLLYNPVPGHSLYPWGVGKTLYSGIFPLISLIMTAAVCHFVLMKFSQPSESTDPADS